MQVIIYHANCSDGFAAATVAYCYYPANAKPLLVECKQGAACIIPMLDKLHHEHPNASVICFDVSFDQASFDKLLQYYPNAHVYDHHESTVKSCRPHPQLHYDVTRSGATLAFDYYHPGEERPSLIKYIEDRDLWQWKLVKSKEVNTWLYNTLSPRLDQLNKWIQLYNSGDAWLAMAISLGESMLQYENHLVNAIVRNATTVFINDQLVKMVESPVLKSELGNALVQDLDVKYALIWDYEPDTDMCRVSLRSNANNPNAANVADVAKALAGGGGHKNAAGFEYSRAKLFAIYGRHDSKL